MGGLPDSLGFGSCGLDYGLVRHSDPLPGTFGHQCSGVSVADSLCEDPDSIRTPHTRL